MKKFRAIFLIATVAATMSAAAAPAGEYQVQVRDLSDQVVSTVNAPSTSFTVEGLDLGTYIAVFSRLDINGAVIEGSEYRQTFVVAEDQPETVAYDAPSTATVTIQAYDVPDS